MAPRTNSVKETEGDFSGSSRQPTPEPGIIKALLGIWWIRLAAVVVALGIVYSLSKPFWYFSIVRNDEVAVQFQGGQIVDVKAPGIVYDFGLFVEIAKVKTSAVAISVSDPEIITSDRQRIGLKVIADVFRPSDPDIVIPGYSRYRSIYLSDESLQNKMNDLAAQAMKVCVGDRKFDEAVIGTARDDLRICIDGELSALAEPFGLEVLNVAVPEVIISPEVQAALDSIVQSRLATEKAKQDAEKEKQEAAARQSAEEGRIRVEQSKLQEEARQQTALQELKQQQLEAELSVILQETLNEIEKLKLVDAQKKVAAAQAQVDIAQEIALAELYSSHPEYVALLVAQANASAIQPTDKIIYTPAGDFPNLILSNGAVLPTVEMK